MENQRAIAAIIISVLILFGYQYFFIPPQQPLEVVEPDKINQNQETRPGTIASQPHPTTTPISPQTTITPPSQTLAGRDIHVNTSLYETIISEDGGTIKNFKLLNFRESTEKDSPAKELITAESAFDLPLIFNWGRAQSPNLLTYTADRESIDTSAGNTERLTMHATQPGLEIVKVMTFSDTSYLVNMDITVRNNGQTPLQGAPILGLTNKPFTPGADNHFIFHGPAVYLNNELHEIPIDDIKDTPQTLSGNLNWLAYEDTYFMCSIIPANQEQNTVTINLKGEDTVVSNISGPQDIIPTGGEITYHYNLYFGPKKIETLSELGQQLEKAIDFGWFDIIAKPTLYLLNFFNTYCNNYGVAIILVTILFKLVFWPISHKGMKSMKTMQKIQPKLAKIREKYKDDRDRLNQEMITLYKTYKINPLGGCLPMLLQIPVFFALYKVLLQTIELRHAPFMLWITDLSAPDRLFIGFDLPLLGGIPILTLLMGGSMFLQQKMTPTAADPTQAKIMMFLPVIFTFMFLNFASGLVLYWFINNLLSIGQQYMINRSVDA